MCARWKRKGFRNFIIAKERRVLTPLKASTGMAAQCLLTPSSRRNHGHIGISHLRRQALTGKYHVFAENRKGIGYDTLFGHHLQGASSIIVTDPYIRNFYQIKNMNRVR